MSGMVLLGASLAGETELLVDVKLTAKGVASHGESGAIRRKIMSVSCFRIVVDRVTSVDGEGNVPHDDT